MSGAERAWTRSLARQHLEPRPIVYAFDGTLEGLLTAVFMAYRGHTAPEALRAQTNLQESLLAQTEMVAADEGLAVRVRDGICRRLGPREFERVRIASLSDDPAAPTTIFRYIVMGMDRGPGVWNDLSDPTIQAFERLWQSVYDERHRILQFARFSLMEGGVYYSRVNPKANVVPVVMDHFCARFNVQPFVIYDEVHGIAGVWDRASWGLVRTDDLTVPPTAAGEEDCRHLWKTFYDHICNERRYNPRLRTQFMPQRLWRNITEMQPEYPTAAAGTRRFPAAGASGHATEAIPLVSAGGTDGRGDPALAPGRAQLPAPR